MRRRSKEKIAIGIRPIIDARRGALKVRESLEEQTMNMARSAAKLFEENLRYSDGTPVRVVIADTTIGRVGETAACAEKFRNERDAFCQLACASRKLANVSIPVSKLLLLSCKFSSA